MRFELTQRIAYLQGLASGLGVDGEAGPEGEVLEGILDVLHHMAQEIDAARAAQSDIAEQIDELSDDMTELAEELMADLSGPRRGGGRERTAGRWEITCPGCHQTFVTTDSAAEDDDLDLVCPHCGHVVHDFDSGLDNDEDSDEVTDRR